MNYQATPEEEKPKTGFGSENWARLISALGTGVQSGLESKAIGAASKRELREKKRRTMANMLNTAMGRGAAHGRATQDYGDEMADFQSRAMQQMAQGFIQALR